MNIVLKTPAELWVEAIKSAFEKIKVLMESKLPELTDLDISLSETANTNEFDFEVDSPSDYYSLDDGAELITIDDGGEEAVSRRVFIDILHAERESWINFTFMVGPFDSDNVSYPELEEINASYQILSEEVIYDEIAKWIRGEELNPQVFIGLAQKYQNEVTS